MADKVQRIRKELERLKEETSIGLSVHENGVEQGRMEIINALSVFLDSLQKEPVSEELEKEMDNYLATVFSKDMDGCKPRFTTWFRALRKTAIHFTNWQKEQMMVKAFDFTKEHNTACVLASECLRGNGWFSKERDFNELFRHLSCVDKLFEGKFSGKTKVIVIKED